MVYDADGFALALDNAEEQPRLPRFLHFGFGVADPDDVRTLRDRLVADGVEIVEESEEPTYVSLKCRDLDGSVMETAWEALEAPARDAGSGRREGAS